MIDKGMFKDCEPLEQPKGTYRHAKNATFDESLKSLSNEDGFKVYSKNTPLQKTEIGYVEIEDELVIFYKDILDSNDEIGIITSNGLYQSIAIGDFNFNVNFPIKGDWIKNYREERIIAWTDNFNSLRYLNIDNSPYIIDGSIHSSRIFLTNIFPYHQKLEVSIPSVSMIKDGNLPSGAYFPFFRFVNLDGKFSNWIMCPKVYAVSDYNGATPEVDVKGLPSGLLISATLKFNLTLNGLNINADNEILAEHDRIQIALVASIGEVTSAKLVLDQQIKPVVGQTNVNISVLIDKFEGDELTLLEILDRGSYYTRVNDLMIQNNQLMGVNCFANRELNYQKYANNIKINYNTINSDVVNGTQRKWKYFMHGEVYSFYIVFMLKTGQWSRAYHIPGRAPVEGETDLHSVLTNNKVYQVDDTSHTVAADTNMGFWENEDEFYPNEPDYDGTIVSDGTPIAGEGVDLRGERVRHHRFPDIRSMKNNEYDQDSDYGKTRLDVLTIDVSNVQIPKNIAKQVLGYKIFYKKRDIQNSINLGSSISIYGAEAKDEEGLFGEDFIFPTGGNFGFDSDSGITITSSKTDRLCKFYGLDLLLDKPYVSPTHIINDLVITSDVEEKTRDTRYLHLVTPTSAAVTESDEVLRQIENLRYIPADTLFGQNYNRYGEEHVEFLVLNAGGQNGLAALNANNNNFLNDQQTEPIDFNEVSYLTSLRQALKNAYIGFDSPLNQLVETDVFVYVDDNGGNNYLITDVGGGDSIVTNNHEYIHTGGLGSQNFPTTGDPATTVGVGNFVYRRICIEGVAFGKLLYQNADNPNSYIPSLFTKGSSLNQAIENVSDLYDPTLGRELLYNKDYNKVNIFNTVTPYRPKDNFTNRFPFRFIRSTSLSRVNEITFNFLTNDKYEFPTDKGELIGLEKIDDKVIIKSRRSTFVTRGSQKIRTSDGDAIIGSSDIFDVEPKEIINIDTGYITHRSRFNSIQTEYGVVFVDIDQQKIFLYNNQLTEISDIGMFNFFNSNLKFFENDRARIEISGVQYAEPLLPYTLKIAKSASDYSYDHFSVGDYVYFPRIDANLKITKVEDTGFSIILTTKYLNSSDTVTVDDLTTKAVWMPRLDSPYNGNGVILGYDRQNKRLLFTVKRDEVPFENDESRFVGMYEKVSEFFNNLEVGDLVADQQGIKFWNGSNINSYSGISGDYTLSYDLRRNVWVSFHDYIPDMYLQLQNNLVSKNFGSNESEFYIHNYNQNKCKFYTSIPAVHEISVVINSDVSSKFTNLRWSNIVKGLTQELKGYHIDDTYNVIKIEDREKKLNTLLNKFQDIDLNSNVRRIGKDFYITKPFKNDVTGELNFQDKYILLTFVYRNDGDSGKKVIYLIDYSTSAKEINKV